MRRIFKFAFISVRMLQTIICSEYEDNVALLPHHLFCTIRPKDQGDISITKYTFELDKNIINDIKHNNHQFGNDLLQKTYQAIVNSASKDNSMQQIIDRYREEIEIYHDKSTDIVNVIFNLQQFVRNNEQYLDKDTLNESLKFYGDESEKSLFIPFYIHVKMKDALRHNKNIEVDTYATHFKQQTILILNNCKTTAGYVPEPHMMTHLEYRGIINIMRLNDVISGYNCQLVNQCMMHQYMQSQIKAQENKIKKARLKQQKKMHNQNKK